MHFYIGDRMDARKLIKEPLLTEWERETLTQIIEKATAQGKIAEVLAIYPARKEIGYVLLDPKEN